MAFSVIKVNSNYCDIARCSNVANTVYSVRATVILFHFLLLSVCLCMCGCELRVANLQYVQMQEIQQ